MAVTPPKVDPRDEETLVADVIDDFPAELSDRNASAPAVKLTEAIGAFYGSLTFWLNQWPERVMVKILELLDIQRVRASSATDTLRFTRSVSDTSRTIPAGTVVKTGPEASAVRFRTEDALILGFGELTGDVLARCTVDGTEGNVPAGTLTVLHQPIPTVTSVTNLNGGSGGQDEETLAAMIARAPLAIRSSDRAITAEDFENLAVESGNGIVRALAYSTVNGGVVVNLLASDFNETPSPSVREAVQEYLTDRTVPGVYVKAYQRKTRWVVVTDVSVELKPGYVEAAVSGPIEEALSGYITPVATYDSDGEVLFEALDYGADLTANDLVPLAKAVEGVKRVVSVTAQYSDDDGDNWSTPAALGTIATPNGEWGLMAWGGDLSGHAGFGVTVV